MSNCAWRGIFNEYEKILLQQGLTASGLMSILLGAWFNLILMVSKLRREDSYNNLANFTLTALMRQIVALLTQLPIIKYLESAYGLDAEYCKFFAFMETFLAVFEVECLTHVCIERYVVAKYITNGWTIARSHYYLFPSLCFVFAFTYSVPPLLGFGHYGYDFTCTTCTLDMVLPYSWDKYLIVAIFILRSVKPIIVMISMLFWAKALEQKYDSSEKTRHLVRFTNCVVKVTVLNIICWAPIATIRGWVILSQILFAQPILAVPVFYIQWAIWIHWASPAVTVIAFFVVDHRIRTEMFFYSKNEGFSMYANKYD